MSSVIKNEAQNTVAKAQAIGSDIFGFGAAIHRKYPKEWAAISDRWDQMFPAIDVEIQVNAQVRHSGELM